MCLLTHTKLITVENAYKKIAKLAVNLNFFKQKSRVARKIVFKQLSKITGYALIIYIIIVVSGENRFNMKNQTTF